MAAEGFIDLTGSQDVRSQLNDLPEGTVVKFDNSLWRVVPRQPRSQESLDLQSPEMQQAFALAQKQRRGAFNTIEPFNILRSAMASRLAQNNQ